MVEITKQASTGLF